MVTRGVYAQGRGLRLRCRMGKSYSAPVVLWSCGVEKMMLGCQAGASRFLQSLRRTPVSLRKSYWGAPYALRWVSPACRSVLLGEAFQPVFE